MTIVSEFSAITHLLVNQVYSQWFQIDTQITSKLLLQYSPVGLANWIVFYDYKACSLSTKYSASLQPKTTHVQNYCSANKAIYVFTFWQSISILIDCWIVFVLVPLI